MADSSSRWQKTLWEKEKLRVPSNFSISHSVLKRKTCPADMLKPGLVWERVI